MMDAEYATAHRIIDSVPLDPADYAESEQRMHQILTVPVPLLIDERGVTTADVASIVVPAVLVASAAVDYISERLAITREEAIFDIRAKLSAPGG